MAAPGDADRLYELPLDRFTQARDDLAAEMKAAGNTEAAAQVKALRKPTVPAWAVNQLVRRHGDEVRSLFDVVERMKDAASPEALRELSDRRRKLVSELSVRAEQVLREAGHAPGGANMERIERTLLATASEEARAELLEGRLTRELTPSGFEALGAPPPTVTPRPDARRSRAVQRAEELAREAEAAAAEAHQLRRGAEAAERTWRKASQQAEAAARRAEQLRERADRAADDLAR